MTLKDISNGLDGVIWIAAIILLLLSIVLLSGHGSWMIAGYNTASEEEKSKYDEKKLCRVMGAGMSAPFLICNLIIRMKNIYKTTPTIVPRVFEMMSVMSVAPIFNMYWQISMTRLKLNFY